jgi:hypothetical protein
MGCCKGCSGILSAAELQAVLCEDGGDVMKEPDDMTQLRITHETRGKLLEIYLGNQEECSKYQLADKRVTVGESAILWLMDKIKEDKP